MFHVTVRVPEMSPPAIALSEARLNASLQEEGEKVNTHGELKPVRGQATTHGA